MYPFTSCWVSQRLVRNHVSKIKPRPPWAISFVSCQRPAALYLRSFPHLLLSSSHSTSRTGAIYLILPSGNHCVIPDVYELLYPAKRQRHWISGGSLRKAMDWMRLFTS